MKVVLKFKASIFTLKSSKGCFKQGWTHLDYACKSKVVIPYLPWLYVPSFLAQKM
jgi:hypothetical protein